MQKYSAKEAAEKLGVSRATLLRWFREERISPVERDWRGWRTFRDDDIERIRRELGQTGSRSDGAPNSKMRSYLSRVPVFHRLPQGLLDQLADCARFQGLLKGSAFFSPGQRCTGLSLLVKGRIRVFRLSPEGREQVLSIVEPYQTLGEAALFRKGALHSSFAVCEVSSTVLTLPLPRVQSLTTDYPELALAFLAEFASRIEDLEERLEETALHSLDRRLAGYLLKEEKVRQEFFPIPALTAMASLFGVARESVSRTLARFEEQGWLEREGREIRILRPDELSSL